MLKSFRASNLRRCSGSARGQTGQAAVEGVLSIWLITLILVVSVALLLFIGNYLFRLLQCSYVAQQAAQYGINKMYFMGLSRHADVTAVEKDVAAAMAPLLNLKGLNGATVSFKEVTDSSNGLAYGQATVSVTGLSVLGGGVSVLGAALPKTMDISSTALALESDNVPPYIACIAFTGATSAAPTGGCVQVPCIGGGPWNGGNPPAYFPYTLSVPGSSNTGAPGYCFLETPSSCTNTSAVRYPFTAGVGWGY